MIVDLFNAIISPAIVGCIITAKGNHGASSGDTWMTALISSILIIQGTLLIFGFMVKRVDFDWQPETNIRMPNIAKNCIYTSMVVLPAIIVVLTVIGAIVLNESVPFLALNLCC